MYLTVGCSYCGKDTVKSMTDTRRYTFCLCCTDDRKTKREIKYTDPMLVNMYILEKRINELEKYKSSSEERFIKLEKRLEKYENASEEQ